MVIIKAVCCLLGVVTAIVILRTFIFVKKTSTVIPCKVLDVDFIEASSTVLQRFQTGIQLKTVSRNDFEYNDVELEGIRKHIETNFNAIHSSPLVKYDVVANYSLLYQVEGSDPTLTPYLLMAHLDVVPADDAEHWDEPPFSGKIRGKYIYGRGAMDNKQSVFGILEAVNFALKSGFKPKRSFYIAFGHDEETGGRKGAMALSDVIAKRHGKLLFVLDEDDWLCFTSIVSILYVIVSADFDTSYRIQLQTSASGAEALGKELEKKGVTNLHFILDEGSGITEGIYQGIYAPIAEIGCSEKGWLSLRLSVNMTGGHSSMPEKESAIGVLSAAVQRLESSQQPSMIGSGPETAMIEHIAHQMSVGLRIVLSNIWLFKPLVNYVYSMNPGTNAVIRTTTAITEFHGGVKDNVISPWAWATVNHRVHPGQTIAQVIAIDKAIINDERVKINIVSAMDPHPVSPYEEDTFGYQTIKTSIRQIWDHKNVVVAPGLMLGNTDTKHYLRFTKEVYRFSPTYMYPGDPKRFHGRNERISIENYEQAINFYYHVIMNADRERLPEDHHHAQEL